MNLKMPSGVKHVCIIGSAAQKDKIETVAAELNMRGVEASMTYPFAQQDSAVMTPEQTANLKHLAHTRLYVADEVWCIYDNRRIDENTLGMIASAVYLKKPVRLVHFGNTEVDGDIELSLLQHIVDAKGVIK